MDAKVFGQEISAMVREHVTRRLEPLEARLAQLEARQDEKAAPYAGVYQRALSYRRGALATHKGSLWAAVRDTEDEPGASASWQLVAKGAAR